MMGWAVPSPKRDSVRDNRESGEKVTTKVTISMNNSKLGAIPSINLPPVITCRSGAPCTHSCYACKGHFIFANVKRSMNGNLFMYKAAPDIYEARVNEVCLFSRFFRWHSAGDIVDAPYLEMMVRVAKRNPQTTFLCFTKKTELVNSYMSDNELPSNLTIVFSAWGNEFVPDNPYNLPVAYINIEGAQIPSDARKCSGNCESCVQVDGGCWNMGRGEAVVFERH